MSSAYFSRHAGAGSAPLRAAFPLALGHAGLGVRACKVSLKEEKRAPSGEPGLLGSGWGRGDIFTVPGLYFLTEVAAVAPHSA